MSAGLLGGAVGAVGGFLLTGTPQGAMYGYSIGSAIGSYINPPKGPHNEGPRLSDLSVQTSTYGAAIPRGYGTFPVVGNVFWLENNLLKEVATTTSSGGKGGPPETSTTSYAYFATFAVGICQGPITGVSRIWVGAKLIYDARGLDPTQLEASAAASTLFTLHVGSNTQLPDDRMQATLGVANTPAYRGLAYIVFKDFPLADHGNTLAGTQVKVEVVKLGAITPVAFREINAAVPAWYVGSTPLGFQIDQYGYCWVHVDNSQLLARVHVPTGNLAGLRSEFDLTAGGGYSLNLLGFDSKGNSLFWTNRPTVVTPEGGELVGATAGAFASIPLVAFGVSEKRWVTITWDRKKLALYDFVLGYIAANAPEYDGTQTVYFQITAGNVLNQLVYFTLYRNGVLQLGCFDPVGNTWGSLFTFPTSCLRGSATTTKADLVAGSDGYYYLYNAGSGVIEKRDVSGIIVASGPSGIGMPVMHFAAGKLLTYTTALPWRWYVLDCSTMESLGYSTWNPSFAETEFYYDTFGTGAMLIDRSSPFLVDILPTTSALLEQIIEDEMYSSEILAPGDVDASALTQSVRGYRVSSVGNIRSAIEPLRGCWPFDVVQHGYQIKCVARGGSSIATVPATDLDARGASDAPGVAVTLVREMDLVLPSRISIKHLDPDREYDVGEQYAERMTTRSLNLEQLDVAVVLTSTEAAEISERLLNLRWLERYDVSVALPQTYNQLEPADVITVSATEGTYHLRLTKITYTQDSRLECQAKYDSAQIYVPAAVGESGQSTGRRVAYAGGTTSLLLDLPLLDDSLDRPAFLVAMCGFNQDWRGGVLYHTADGQTWTPLRTAAYPGAVIGLVDEAVGAGMMDRIDSIGFLSVRLLSGALASVSEAAMLNGANHFAYGADGRWEIIAAKTCTLFEDGGYRLLDMLRGRGGTEWAVGLHLPGDWIVLLDSATLGPVSLTLDDIGIAGTYRSVTVGKTLGDSVDVGFTYTGVNLECLSPVYLNGNRNASTNDWTLEWIRRTRVGGEWRDYVDAPLSEATESYVVEIYSSNTYTTLKRTLTSSAPTVTYPSAGATGQVNDFGSNQSTLYVKVYQVSANVGRGYPLTTSITR